MLLLTLPGTKFIYYGEEIGMANSPIPEKKRQDNFTENERGDTRDQSRTPMQWDDSTYAGFSSVEPWLPVAETKNICNVVTEEKDENSLLNLYKKLIELQKKESALTAGSYVSFSTTSHHVFAFKREYEGKILLVYLNFMDAIRKIELPEGKYEIVLSTNPQTDVKKSMEKELTLTGSEGVILRSK